MIKKLSQLVIHIDQLAKNEGWEPDARDNVEKYLKRLSHALDVNNIKLARKAIEQLSKYLLNK